MKLPFLNNKGQSFWKPHMHRADETDTKDIKNQYSDPPIWLSVMSSLLYYGVSFLGEGGGAPPPMLAKFYTYVSAMLHAMRKDAGAVNVFSTHNDNACLPTHCSPSPWDSLCCFLDLTMPGIHCMGCHHCPGQNSSVFWTVTFSLLAIRRSLRNKKNKCLIRRPRPP